MWFHFWIAFHLYDVAVAPVTIISSMMQSTLTLKIDKLDVSMVFIVAHSRSRTHIIWYKLEIFGLDFSFCSSCSPLFRTLTLLILFIISFPLPCSSARRLFVTLSFSMHFAVDYKRLSNLDVKYVIKPNVFKTHFTLIDQYIGRSKSEYFIAMLLQSVCVCVWGCDVYCTKHDTPYRRRVLLSPFIMTSVHPLSAFRVVQKGNRIYRR